MYLFGLLEQNGSRAESMLVRWVCDGCPGSRMMRTVFNAARMQVSRQGSLREVLLAKGESDSKGDWKVDKAAARSPVP